MNDLNFSFVDTAIEDEKSIEEEESKIAKRKITSKDNQKSVKRIKDEKEDNVVGKLEEQEDLNTKTKIEKSEKEEEIVEKRNASKLKKAKTTPEQVEPELFSKSRLKKTEVIKRKVEAPKMEEVKLKHHDFECAPLEPTKEEKSSVKISKPLKDLSDSEKKTKKIKKVIKKPKEDDNKKQIEPAESNKEDINGTIPDESEHFEHLGDDIISEQDVPSDESIQSSIQEEYNPKDSNETEVQKIAIEELDNDDNKVFKPSNVKPKSEKITTEPSQVKEQVKIEPKPKIEEEKPKAKIEEEKPMPKIEEKKPKPKSNEEKTKSKLEDEKTKAKPKKTIEEKIEEMKTKDKPKAKAEKVEEPEMFSKSRLKKVETVKKEIEKPKIEKVALKHHSFEQETQDTAPEEKTKVKLTGKGEIIDDKEKVKKVKKAIKKTKKESPQMEEPDIENQDVTDNVEPDGSKLSQPIENESMEEITPREDDKVNKMTTEPKTVESNKPLKKVSTRKPIVKENIEEPEIFSKSRLKKAATVKRDIDSPTLEKVDLKHHDFENTPLDTDPEEKTAVKLGKPLKELDSDKDKKVKKVRKTKSEKPEDKSDVTKSEVVEEKPQEVSINLF